MTFEESLSLAWREGVFRGEGARWRAVSAEKPDDVGGRAFATIATLLSDEPARVDLETGPGDADPATAVLHWAALTWWAAQRYDVNAARVGVEGLEASLREAEWRLQIVGLERRVAAEGWADLALGQVCLRSGDPAGAVRRFRTARATAAAPPGVRLAGMVALAVEARDPFAPLSTTIRLLDEATALAGELERADAAAHSAFNAALLLFMGGDSAEGTRRLRPIAEGPGHAAGRYRLIARLLLAGDQDGDAVLAELTQGLHQVAADGDYAGYVTLILQGARTYEERGRLADAIATLSFGIAHLERVDKVGFSLGLPLREHRDQLHDRVGGAAYEAAAREALERIPS